MVELDVVQLPGEVRPYLTLHLANTSEGTRKNAIPLDLLLDSGASNFVLDGLTCGSLGIDLKSGVREEITLGDGNTRMEAYVHDVHMWIHTKGPERVKVFFCDALNGIAPLGYIGVSGFFDRFKVTIDVRGGKVWVEDAKQPAKAK